MKNKIYTLAVLATFALTGTAMADDMPSAKAQTTYEATDNGGYTKSDKTSSTDANGTTVTHTASKKVAVDSNGNTTTKVDIKDKTSPKGIFSKSSTVETKNTSTAKDGKVESEHVKTVNGDTVEKSDDVMTK